MNESISAVALLDELGRLERASGKPLCDTVVYCSPDLTDTAKKIVGGPSVPTPRPGHFGVFVKEVSGWPANTWRVYPAGI